MVSLSAEKLHDEQCRIVVYLDDLQAKVNALPAPCTSGQAQSAGAEELRPLFGQPLMPSILDRAFKGEL
jgi:hypothetical protein